MKNLPTTLSAEARQMAEEAAGKVPRYKRSPERAAHFRTTRESVSNFVAGVAVKNALDMERTVQELRPELPAAQAAIIAEKLEHDPNVQHAIQKTLEKRGLDNKSKEHYVDLLWKCVQRVKSFISGVFTNAKNQGYFDGVNPVRDADLPKAAKGQKTHA